MNCALDIGAPLDATKKGGGCSCTLAYDVYFVLRIVNCGIYKGPSDGPPFFSCPELLEDGLRGRRGGAPSIAFRRVDSLLHETEFGRRMGDPHDDSGLFPCFASGPMEESSFTKLPLEQQLQLLGRDDAKPCEP